MTSSMLNINQSTNELNEVYSDDYYWYLYSPEFREAFHKPIADWVNNKNYNCLDVACGEGWLAPLITSEYLGIDGSEVAISRAKELYPDKEFLVGRIEEPPVEKQFDAVIFGGIFLVLIKPEYYLQLAKKYVESTKAKAFIVYDLGILDTKIFEENYSMPYQLHASADVDNIQEVKKHRKIMVFSCQ